jgi:alginate O-acetyltransferase complex protein AlgI
VIFTEFRFVVFFALVFAVHWALRSIATRKLWLLGASWFFYAAWDWRFLGLILFSTLVDYGVGVLLDREERSGRRRLYLAFSLIGNLGLLGAFKYYDFFITSGASVLGTLGMDVTPRTLGWILPVGISFYTFQTLSYTIDVYRRTLSPVKSFLDFALFVGFFPQLVAGPIVRASHFLPQLEGPRLFRNIDVRACLTLFLIGFIKKAVVSDHVAGVTDDVFASPAQFSAASNWIALFLYHAQIYCDFSGYSDMAVGTAGLFGYHLPKNFDFPFFSRNISEFWRRWHITLSTWFRDYLYMSLGGSRSTGLWASIAVGCFTMMICGIWHGAGWQYVGFGVLMSSAIAISRLWEQFVPKESTLRRAVHFLGIPIMWWFLFVNWIVFRAVGWDEAMEMFRIFFFLDGGGARQVDPAWLLVFGAFFGVHMGLYFGALQKIGARIFRHDLAYAAVLGIATAVVLALMAVDYQPFIYFQF